MTVGYKRLSGSVNGNQNVHPSGHDLVTTVLSGCLKVSSPFSAFSESDSKSAMSFALPSCIKPELALSMLDVPVKNARLQKSPIFLRSQASPVHASSSSSSSRIFLRCPPVKLSLSLPSFLLREHECAAAICHDNMSAREHPIC